MQFLLDLPVGRRLALGLASIISIFLAMLAVVYVAQSRSIEAENWNTHTYKVLATSDRMLASMVNMETGARGFLLAGEDRYLEPWNAGLSTFDQGWTEAKRLTSDNREQQARLDEMKARHQEFRGVVESMLAARREVKEGKRPMDQFLAVFAQGRDKTAMDAFRKLAGEFDGAERHLLESRSAEVQRLHSTQFAAMLGGSALALLLALVVGAWMTRSITGPVAAALGSVERVAGGDLTGTIVARNADEIGRLMTALSTMQGTLAHFVKDIQRAGDSVALASSEISQGNLDLSSRTESQASALQESAASMKQLSTTVQQNASSAVEGSRLAASASAVAERCGGLVSDVVSTMQQINDSSRKIAEIISVIDGIAFQTNILALNAAVEAARAGEQGRGFAVVAGEVRTLAQRSADAAKEIKGLITDSVDRVAQGCTLVDQAGVTMKEVVSSVQKVAQLTESITGASREQSAGVDQIGVAIQQLDSATQQNAALVEESAAAASSLKTQAQQLVVAAAQFRVAG